MPPWGYALVLAGSLVLSLLLTPMALRAALRRQFLDRPGEIKSQTSPVPYLGGLAIVGSFCAVVMAAGLATNAAPGLDAGGLEELGIILGLGFGLAVLGLIDDLRGLSPWARLAVEVAAATALWSGAGGVQLFGAGAVNLVLTVGWVVLVMNAMNLLDNMDGLSAGVAAIAALSFFAIAAIHGQFLVATLSLGLAGCAAGFLRSNFHPARIYMGDAGSLFLGFILAVIGVRLRFDGPTQVTFAVPVLALGVPLFDTGLVIVNRLRHQRSPLTGGRDHTSHRLVRTGVPVRAAVALIYVGSVSVGWLAVVLSRLDRPTGWLLMGWVLFIAALLGYLLSRVPVYEPPRRRATDVVGPEPGRAGMPPQQHPRPG